MCEFTVSELMKGGFFFDRLNQRLYERLLAISLIKLLDPIMPAAIHLLMDCTFQVVREKTTETRRRR